MRCVLLLALAVFAHLLIPAEASAFGRRGPRCGRPAAHGPVSYQPAAAGYGPASSCPGGVCR